MPSSSAYWAAEEGGEGHADETGAPAGQAGGGDARHEAVLLHDAQDVGAGGGIDVGLLVDDARDGSFGDPSEPGDVVDGLSARHAAPPGRRTGRDEWAGKGWLRKSACSRRVTGPQLRPGPRYRYRDRGRNRFRNRLRASIRMPRYPVTW